MTFKAKLNKRKKGLVNIIEQSLSKMSDIIKAVKVQAWW